MGGEGMSAMKNTNKLKLGTWHAWEAEQRRRLQGENSHEVTRLLSGEQDGGRW